MVRLGRFVRFSINPFLDEDSPGCNSYASKPAGEGLCVYLEMAAELVGPVRPETGLLVNVSDIDRVVRQCAVPVFARRIREHLRRGEHVPLAAASQILWSAYERLADKFDSVQVDRLCLKLNPFRKLAMDTKTPGTLYFSEKFEFAAMHKLWNDAFSPQWNLEIFGKCANPTGHGHNYVVEVTVATPAGGPALKIGQFEQTVDSHLMQLVDHKNLNIDVAGFEKRIATVENLAIFAWERLEGRFDPGRLHCVTVWESDRTYCSYYGPAGTGRQA
ncbi:MAG TPA: 6-carboxytetrahydropterin synthase [Sedimentisphaerales bacterium]|nr:6-carboxytetrahydropterin synthase [Sedimentisphaerales bacterium]